MRMCPFWSTEEEQVNCYKECPIVQELEKSDECVFREYLEFNDFKLIEL